MFYLLTAQQTNCETFTANILHSMEIKVLRAVTQVVWSYGWNKIKVFRICVQCGQWKNAKEVQEWRLPGWLRRWMDDAWEKVIRRGADWQEEQWHMEGVHLSNDRNNIIWNHVSQTLPNAVHLKLREPLSLKVTPVIYWCCHHKYYCSWISNIGKISLLFWYHFYEFRLFFNINFLCKNYFNNKNYALFLM